MIGYAMGLLCLALLCVFVFSVLLEDWEDPDE